MRNRFEVSALIAIVLFVAVATRWWSQRPQDVPPPPPAPGATPVRAGGDFALADLNGAVVQCVHDGHPLFIILTAVGCGDCRARVPLDRQAIEAMHKASLPVWNILVYANQANGRQFVDQFHPSEDKILVDPSGRVAVQQLGGSDASCWIMLDGDHRVTWQGPGAPANIELALNSVPLQMLPHEGI